MFYLGAGATVTFQKRGLMVLCYLRTVASNEEKFDTNRFVNLESALRFTAVSCNCDMPPAIYQPHEECKGDFIDIEAGGDWNLEIFSVTAHVGAKFELLRRL